MQTFNGPEQRLWRAKQRHAELIHEADMYRLGRARPDEPTDQLASRLVSPIRGSLGERLVGVRRMFSGYELPCSDPCPDCAPC